MGRDHGAGDCWGAQDGQGRAGSVQCSTGQGLRGAVPGWYSPHAVRGPCSAARCRVGAVWCRCRATQCWAGAASPPGTPALTAQEGLDLADELPQLPVGALHTGPGLVRFVQGCLSLQPGLICLPLGLGHLSRGRDPQHQPQGLGGTAMPATPTSPHVPRTLWESWATSPAARRSSSWAWRARSSALSAVDTAPPQLRPPQRRPPSSSRHPAPPQGLSAQGTSPAAPHTCKAARARGGSRHHPPQVSSPCPTFSLSECRLSARALPARSISARRLAAFWRLKSSRRLARSCSVRCRVAVEALTGLGTARVEASARRSASRDSQWDWRMLS